MPGNWMRSLSQNLLMALLLLTMAIPAGAQDTASPKAKPKAKTTTGAKPATPPAGADARSEKSEAPDSVAVSEAKALEKLLIEQRGLIDAQQKRIDELTRTLVSLHGRLLQLEALRDSAGPPGELEARLKRLEAATEKSPELPSDLVSAGTFPGSIRVPGTDAAFKFGGSLWASLVGTLDALGSDDRFLTNSIPVEGAPGANKGARLSLFAEPTRVNFDYRTPARGGVARVFIEGDFMGSGGSLFRLRHAFGQLGGFLCGQTWSTFSDQDCAVEDLDFEGLNAENLRRQPLVRYGWVRGENLRFAGAVEQPFTSVEGGGSVNQIPDFVSRAYWRFTDGHFQTALVLRQPRAAPDSLPNEVRADFGWGVSVSGVLPIRALHPKDRFVFQFNGGEGVARYINDLSSAGGQDAVFDTQDNSLRALPAWGFYVDVEHHWLKPREEDSASSTDLRTSIIFGFVQVENLDVQSGDAYHSTYRLSGNLVWSPANRIDVGAQFIYGERENKDGASGRARQVQLRARFYF